jgi:hypothetical protein
MFADVRDFAPWHTFRRLLAKYRGDFNTRTFSCLDQFLSMAFAQITYRRICGTSKRAWSRATRAANAVTSR